MSFIWPYMLLTLLFVPLLVAVYIRLQHKRKRALANLGALGMASNSAGQPLGKRRHGPALFFLGGLALTFFGLARPEMVVSLPRIEGTVILAFDVSNSMAAEDLEPTRIEAAKAAATAFIQEQPDTIRIGVVAFSRGGLVVQQPSNDRTISLGAIERLSPEGSTSLGQGIFTALNAIAGEPIAIDPAALELAMPEEGEFEAGSSGAASLDSLEIGHYPSSVILLLTDGENMGPPDPLAIAQLAAQANVRIYTVGIGSTEGAILEIDGFLVQTQLNEQVLQEIANMTNGEYFHATDEESLQEIYENVDLRLTVEAENMEITAVIAGLSILFLLAGGALSLLWFGRAP